MSRNLRPFVGSLGTGLSSKDLETELQARPEDIGKPDGLGRSAVPYPGRPLVVPKDISRCSCRTAQPRISWTSNSPAPWPTLPTAATTSWLCFWADGPSTVVVYAHDVDGKLPTAFSDFLDTVAESHCAAGSPEEAVGDEGLPGYECRKGISGG